MTTVVVESLSYCKTNVLFQRILQDFKIIFYILDNMTRSLNSRCDFENGFFTSDLLENTVLLILKVKTQTGNHTLVEDMEKWTEKFQPWKKPIKDGK